MAQDPIIVIPASQLKELLSEVIQNHFPEGLNHKQLSTTVEEYITREETAKKLRISLPTLNTLTKSGKLLGYRIGRRVLYKLTEVEKSIEAISTGKYR